MKCNSNLCQDGLGACPTPQHCDWVPKPADFADTVPIDVPNSSVQMIRWSFWLSVGLGILLFLLGTYL
jgi:hypothetical protein